MPLGDDSSMKRDELLKGVVVDPNVCGGKPCVRGTCIYIAIILDSLAEGLTHEEIIETYPSLNVEAIRAALAYAAELCREGFPNPLRMIQLNWEARWKGIPF